MTKRLLANLGFLLQIAGLLTILPICIALIFNETQTIISLFLACVAFLGSGFLSNALCERKDLDFKGSNFLFIATFIVLPLIGALPYFYLDLSPEPAIKLFQSSNIIDTFTNGLFESVSGFTTTGFSFISSPETLPISIRIYRSLTELMGGVGIVFLLLAFFESKKTLGNLTNTTGMTNIGNNLKKMYLLVFATYSACIGVFIAIFYALGFTNIVNTGTYVIDTLTGGFTAPATQFEQYMSMAAPKIFTITLMLFGAINFGFLYCLLTGKFKRTLSWEVIIFLLFVILGTISISVVANLSALDSLFHVVSLSSSVGYSYLPLTAFGGTGLSILTILMLIGGCTFSMAGGIRISRIITFAKVTKNSIIALLIKEQAITKTTKDNNATSNGENLSSSISILLFTFTLVVLAILFTTIGVSFTDALFEVGSAITTAGISTGVTTVTMPIFHKWIMIAAMTIGRVEVLAILLALFTIGRKSPKQTQEQ